MKLSRRKNVKKKKEPDEELTKSEYEQIFECFDWDKNRFLDKKELKDLFEQLGQPKEDTEIVQNIRKYKKKLKKGEKETEDSKNALNKKEFASMMMEQSKKRKNLESDIQKAFSYFDKNGDGSIELSEVRAILHSFGEDLLDSEIDEFIEQADVNGDGDIDYDEFRTILMNKYFKDDRR